MAEPRVWREFGSNWWVFDLEPPKSSWPLPHIKFERMSGDSWGFIRIDLILKHCSPNTFFCCIEPLHIATVLKSTELDAAKCEALVAAEVALAGWIQQLKGR